MVSWDDYHARVQAIDLQFAYLTNQLSRNTDVGEWLDHLRPFLERLHEREEPPGSKEPWSLDAESAPADARLWAWHERSLYPAEPPPPPTPKGLVERILQSELVIRLAHFEVFMKDVHRAVLRVAPTLSLSDKQVHLGRVIGGGIQGVIEEEIERAVHALDRKSIAERARHFAVDLGLKCFPAGGVETLTWLNDLRNTVLHGDPELQLEESRLRQAYPILLDVPWWAAALASEKYPGSCEAPRGRTR